MTSKLDDLLAMVEQMIEAIRCGTLEDSQISEEEARQLRTLREVVTQAGFTLEEVAEGLANWRIFYGAGIGEPILTHKKL